MYTGLVKEMIKNDEVRLVVNVNDLRKKNSSRTVSLLNNSHELLAFERALREFVGILNPDYLRRKKSVSIGLAGSKFGATNNTPRAVPGLFTKKMGSGVTIQKSAPFTPNKSMSMAVRTGNGHFGAQTSLDKGSPITISKVKEEHVFKTPSKPAPEVITPARKRKASGSSMSELSSPRSSSSVLTPLSKETHTSQKARSISGRLAAFGNITSAPAVPKSAASTPNKSKHRYETSLGQLTKKFISLLKQAPEGVSD